MRDLIEYVAEILNIKTNSDLVILDIKEELESIVDLADYRRFLKTNLNHIDVTYLTGFQKFVKLTEMYRKLYARATNQDRLTGARKSSILLAKKVRGVATTIYANGTREPSEIMDEINPAEITIGGEPLFTKYELSQIAKVGGLRKSIELQRSESGGDRLLDKLIELSEAIVVNKALGYDNNRTHHSVAGLIGQTVKQIRA